MAAVIAGRRLALVVALASGVAIAAIAVVHVFVPRLQILPPRAAASGAGPAYATIAIGVEMPA
jgi:hypothetical protein